MKRSAIVLLVPDKEISDHCGNILADILCDDLECKCEDIQLFQLNSKELVQGIAAHALIASGKVNISSYVEENGKDIKGAIDFIRSKYGSSGHMPDIDKFRISIILDANNAFNSSSKGKSVAEFKKALYTIGRNKKDVLVFLDDNTALKMEGFTPAHIEAISDTHNYYSKEYV